MLLKMCGCTMKGSSKMMIKMEEECFCCQMGRGFRESFEEILYQEEDSIILWMEMWLEESGGKIS